MKVPRLEMQSIRGQISIEQTQSHIEIKQHHAKQSIEQPKAEMTINTTPGTLNIDQTQAWEERNLMSTLRLNEMHAQEGMRAIQEGMARRAEQGAQLIRIEEDVNYIAEQAIENGHPQMKQLSIKYVPSPFSVKINYEPGDLDIDVQPRKPIIEVEPQKPEVTFYRGGVNISMAQYPELQISVVDLYV